MSKASSSYNDLKNGDLYITSWDYNIKSDNNKDSFFVLAQRCLDKTKDLSGDELHEVINSKKYKKKIEAIKTEISNNAAGPVLLSKDDKIQYIFTLANMIIARDAMDLTQSEYQSKQLLSFRLSNIDEKKNEFLQELLKLFNSKMKQVVDNLNTVKYLDSDNVIKQGFGLGFSPLFYEDDLFSVALKMKKEKKDKKWEPTDQPSIKISNMKKAYMIDGKIQMRPFKQSQTHKSQLYKLFGQGTTVRGIIRFEWSMSKSKLSANLGFAKGSISIKSIPPSENADSELIDAWGTDGIEYNDEEDSEEPIPESTIESEIDNALDDI